MFVVVRTYLKRDLLDTSRAIVLGLHEEAAEMLGFGHHRDES